jgi:hypothetical protein
MHELGLAVLNTKDAIFVQGFGKAIIQLTV